MRKWICGALCLALAGWAAWDYAGWKRGGGGGEPRVGVGVVGDYLAAERALYTSGAEWSERVYGRNGVVVGVVGFKGLEVSGILIAVPEGYEREWVRVRVARAAERMQREAVKARS